MTRKVKRNLRSLVAIVVLALVAVVFSGRLLQIQVVEAAAYNEVSQEKRAVPFTIPSVRGDIVDRNGTVLATTDELYDVQLSPKNTQVHGARFYRYASPDSIETVEVTTLQAYEEIAEITGQTADEIEQIVDEALAENEQSDFAYVMRGVTLEQLNELKALYIPWLTFDYHYLRLYPNGAVGGNIVGFAGYNAEPQAGIELSQAQCLQGVDGYETFERGADGVALPGSHVVREQAIPGGTVELTIDVDLQWQAQQLVDEYTRRLGTEWTLAVIQDVQTGELLAVAEDHSVDPGDVNATDDSRRNARSFVAPFEPGSTLKTVTMAALLEEGLITPTTEYETPWTLSPEPGVRFSDWFEHAPMPWTAAGIYVNSSNVGTAMLGKRLTPQQHYDYLVKFGMGYSTNAGMPLEDSGLLYQPQDWDRQTSYNIFFGQGVSSTIVQTASIHQTIANGGVRVPPKLVKGCRDADGVLHEWNSGDPQRVVSEKTSEQMIQMMEGVVDHHWQNLGVIPGYRIAGKTGTGEQTDGAGSYREDFVYSFAATFPANDPQYVIVAALGFPDSYETGSPGAVTLTRELAEATIRTMKVEPTTGTPKLFPLEYE